MKRVINQAKPSLPPHPYPQPSDSWLTQNNHCRFVGFLTLCPKFMAKHSCIIMPNPLSMPNWNPLSPSLSLSPFSPSQTCSYKVMLQFPNKTRGTHVATPSPLSLSSQTMQVLLLVTEKSRVTALGQVCSFVKQQLIWKKLSWVFCPTDSDVAALTPNTAGCDLMRTQGLYRGD